MRFTRYRNNPTKVLRNDVACRDANEMQLCSKPFRERLPKNARVRCLILSWDGQELRRLERKDRAFLHALEDKSSECDCLQTGYQHRGSCDRSWPVEVVHGRRCLPPARFDPIRPILTVLHSERALTDHGVTEDAFYGMKAAGYQSIDAPDANHSNVEGA